MSRVRALLAADVVVSRALTASVIVLLLYDLLPWPLARGLAVLASLLLFVFDLALTRPDAAKEQA